jgi:5-methylcytosine-specific restriction endonuclease McrA
MKRDIREVDSTTVTKPGVSKSGAYFGKRLYHNGDGRRRQRIRSLRRRDGDLRSICGGPMKFGPRFKDDPDQVSIDHIIPLSHGGPNSMDNYRLAHRRCNCERGAVNGGASRRELQRWEGEGGRAR